MPPEGAWEAQATDSPGVTPTGWGLMPASGRGWWDVSQLGGEVRVLSEAL